ncbi:P-loop containing nucleoside triphosphate hydrolase protein [Massariosphaeria phaeospora]|uniref:P-loop containing nucleoside triphosphate hydrolase protein n=1 Tax=Massariosphaeria phaeospora TaxID=100035 RepID=A0A7C8MKU5_9PLEO|nr:P-loop containing nucleoside triphosphate hydrolase protein [Massariosphaeria phaeospora]
MAANGASSISVTVRVRPFTIREAAQLAKCDDHTLFLGEGSLAAAPTPRLHQKGIRPVIKVVDERCLIFDPPEDNPVQRFSRSLIGPSGKRVKDQTFAFDRVFDESTTQGDVYESTTKPLLDSVLDGYNATVFAYGATGCGKTHTITGTSQQPGIIFLTMQELFEKIGELQEEKVTEITLSYLEIYNETIRDLLVEGGSKQTLMLREDANQAVSVAGLSSHRPQNVQEVMDIIIRGNEYRTMSPTEANATSSRSHAVLQINVSSRDRNASVNEPHTMATLSIIDLAGSERASATKNRGERLLEGANINKSLLALGSCINALCDVRKRNHVPYRNSKLTRLLKFSLGGNCRTVMIVCVSPSSAHFDETQNTLRYANRAKNIQTKVTKNIFNVNRHVKDYLKKIDEQRAMIDELLKKQKDSEGGAFVKFQKQSEKREGILRDAIVRLRQAYTDSDQERRERLQTMKTSKQAEKRVSLISAWIAAFDNVREIREREDLPSQVSAMRDTAVGISVELEQTRQHCHRRLDRTNWSSKLDTALHVGLRQLSEVDGSTDGNDSANLNREYELLKSNAEREVYAALIEQDRGGDAAIVQVLVQAHLETVAILSQITQMDEEEAVQAARKVLTKIMSSCTNATSQAIRPDGGLPVTEYFAPSHRGTPKRRKPMNIVGPSPMRALPMPSLTEAPHLTASPMKGSPRRRKLGVAKKGVQFSPVRKKSPSKGKRGVRWRDENDNGALAEFEKTPEHTETTPTVSSIELPPPTYSAPIHAQMMDQNGSSPIPSPPKTSMDLSKPRSSRFQTGFLLKRTDGSPPMMGALSDSESSPISPLREIGTNSIRPSGLSAVENAPASSDVTPSESCGNSSGSDEDKWSNSDARKIGSTLKRRSSTNQGGSAAAVNRTHRRRSPTAATSCSPPNENALFSASAARRMVKSERDGADWKNSVLSPRSAPILKGAMRRTTLAAPAAGEADRLRDVPGLKAAPMRVSSTSLGRGSLMGAGKGAWR